MQLGLFSDKTIQALCWTLLHSLWQGLLLAIITGMVMLLSKKSSAALRYNLLSAIFLVFIAVVGFTFLVQLQAAQNSILLNTGLPTAFSQTAVNAGPGAIGSGSSQALRNYLAVFTEYFNTHSYLVVTVWFIVFMARCIKILSGLITVQRLLHYKTYTPPPSWEAKINELAVRLDLHKTVRLLESAIIQVPVVVGFLKPTILVPLGLLTGLSPAQVESILIHELAHIRRKDYFFNLLQRFIDVLFFFNPAILWISALIRTERENCCDDIAISEVKSKKQFVQALVSFYEYNRSGPSYALQFAGRKHGLVNRVKRIVNNNNQTLNPAEKIILAGSLMIFGVICLSISKGEAGIRTKQAQQVILPYRSYDTIPQQDVKKATGKAAAQKEQHASHLKKNTGNTSKPVNTGESDTSHMQETNQTTGSLTDPALSDEPARNNNFIRRLQQLGFKNISIDKEEELRNHGVNAEFIGGFMELGFKDITLEKAIQMRDHGVNPEFVDGFVKMGFSDLSLNRAQDLRDHGVSTSFIRDFLRLGFKNISLDRAQELRDHGISADYINGFITLGYNDISLETAQRLRDHGVGTDFIRGFNELGFKNISLEKAQQLRDHGVNPDYVKSFQELGFGDISLEKAIELRNHGVNGSFIIAMKKKTGSDHSLDEYIILRDHL